MVHSLYLRKRTTDKQFSLLKSRMESFLQKNKNCYKNFRANSRSRIQNDKLHWTDLTEKLNNLGPPYRTRQQWKKVWCDVKRAEHRRNVKSKPKVVQYNDNDPNYDNDISEREIDGNFSETASSSELKIHIKSERTEDEPKVVHNIEKDLNYNNKISESDMDGNISETATSSKLDIHIKSERNYDEQNSQSMHTKFSNDYDNDYSYPDEDSLEESYRDDKETFMPDESSSVSHSYVNKSRNLGRSVNQPPHKKMFHSPPPLQPSNSLILDQTMYSLQNQMEHQSKYLEHLSQMSTTMATLMERQVGAIEKQTEAMHRQAFATERHTSVMNNFIDMIRDKMLKNNSHRERTPTENSTDDIL